MWWLVAGGAASGGTPSITSLLLQISTLWEKKTIQPEERWFSQYFITKQKGGASKDAELTLCSPSPRPGVWGMICLIYLWRLWAWAIHHNYAGLVSGWRTLGTSLSLEIQSPVLLIKSQHWYNGQWFVFMNYQVLYNTPYLFLVTKCYWPWHHVKRPYIQIRNVNSINALC